MRQAVTLQCANAVNSTVTQYLHVHHNESLNTTA